MPLPKPVSSGSSSIGNISKDRLLKLNDGQEVKVVFRGDPLVFYQRWPKGGQKEVFSTPEPGSRPRYFMNAIVRDGASFVAKVFEMASPTYSMLFKINEHLPIEKTKVLVSRMGSGTNTKYALLALPHEALSERELAEIDAVKLNDLSPDSVSESESSGTSEGGGW